MFLSTSVVSRLVSVIENDKNKTTGSVSSSNRGVRVHPNERGEYRKTNSDYSSNTSLESLSSSMTPKNDSERRQQLSNGVNASFGGRFRIDPGARNELPDDYGILLRLYPDGTVKVTSVPDKHYPEIHPNAFAPADLTDVHLLTGGGSGAAVFHGYNPSLSSVVMKHAGPKDTKEVFSLVGISLELSRRQQQRGTRDCEAAVTYMKQRIPEFVMLYISPNHVRDRGKELWATLRNFTLADILGCVDESGAGGEGVDGSFTSLKSSLASSKQMRQSTFATEFSAGPRRSNARRESLKQLTDCKYKRRLSIAPGKEMSFDVNFKNLYFYVPGLQPDGTIAGGASFLMELADELAVEQEANNWKVTLGQKKIGGENAENGAHVLTSGKLMGALLITLLNEFTDVMRNLRELTLPHEIGDMADLEKELTHLSSSRDVVEVSKKMDAFVGSAIKKNFKPGTGRFKVLRQFGQMFREATDDLSDDLLYLADEEILPARLLGKVLKRGSSLGDVFVNAPSSHCALDHVENRWLDVIEHALSLSDNHSAVDRIWTCGLTDAGLHNTFLSESRGLELFDLGEPHLMPLPAFMTKFLMSFFHTSGMEEETEKIWVCRFQVVDADHIDLTPETVDRIPYLYDAYSAAVNQFTAQVFDGDERVKGLLCKYVVLQLLSDSAFCLDKWQRKGGGTERYGNRASISLDKWLWRSLWDLYIATHVYDTMILKASNSVKQCNSVA